MMQKVRKEEVFPEPYSQSLCSMIEENLKKEVSSYPGKVIALDDDPTGVQTVHGIHVYTHWDEESISKGFDNPEKLFFILTNSRAFSKEKTVEVHQTIAHRIARISQEKQIPFLLISRGDSTLRGHYPLETDTLRKVLEEESGYTVDGEILCPYFQEGGRYTIDDIHYVAQNDLLIPCADTEFAKDETFGYTHSDLKEYIEEKTHGTCKASQVVSISLQLLRNTQYDAIEQILLDLKPHTRIIVNACDDHDVMVFVTAMYRAMRKGKHFLIRSAAAFVKAAGGIDSIPLLKAADLHIDKERPGLIMVGSHTAKTTAQMHALRDIPGLVFLELNSDLVTEPVKLMEDAERTALAASKALKDEHPVCISTKRQVLTLPDDTPERALARSVRISDSLQSIIRKLTIQPGWIIAKGGITSSDIGVKALGVHCAFVPGQLEPGIPVWKTDETSFFPEIPYIIFPGNVGQEDTLLKCVRRLLGNNE
jgi:uncharacterized protein YgbK (DUF1537 family)